MMMPDYHTIHQHAKERVDRCYRNAQHRNDDLHDMRHASANVLRWLADWLEPRQHTKTTLPRIEVYAHE